MLRPVDLFFAARIAVLEPGRFDFWTAPNAASGLAGTLLPAQTASRGVAR